MPTISSQQSRYMVGTAQSAFAKPTVIAERSVRYGLMIPKASDKKARAGRRD